MSTYALRSNEDNDFNSILQQLMARDMRWQVAWSLVAPNGTVRPDEASWWYGRELGISAEAGWGGRILSLKFFWTVMLCSIFCGGPGRTWCCSSWDYACEKSMQPSFEKKWVRWISLILMLVSLSGPCPRGTRTYCKVLMAHQRLRIESQWGRFFLDTASVPVVWPIDHVLVSWNLCPQQDPGTGFDLRRTLKMSEIRPCVADFPCKGTQKGLAHGLFDWSGNSSEGATRIGTAAYACNSRVS